jgi:hypothetical protein
MKPYIIIIASIAITLSSSLATVHAAVIDFHFTGRLTVVNPDASDVVPDAQSADVFDPYGYQTPITSTFTYDTSTGIGAAESFIAPFDFFGFEDTLIYDMSMQRIDDTNLILGNMLIDWGPNIGLPVSMVWDASGLFGALNLAPGGLQINDVISGTNLIRNGEVIEDVGSAIPATDGLTTFNGYTINQGAAPLAMTTWDTTPLCTPVTPGSGECVGINPIGGLPLYDDGIAGSPMLDGPFPGMNINLDLGSGNSLTVLSISAVPLPPAIWLFGTGLLGLIGIARRKKAA